MCYIFAVYVRISVNSFHGRIRDIYLESKYLAERDHSLINIISLHLLRGTEENHEELPPE